MASMIKTHRRNKAIEHSEDYRQSVPFVAAETSRNSFASRPPPNTYRSSDLTNLVHRPSHARLPTKPHPVPHPKTPSSLLCTLHQLEVKLLEAKKQLNVAGRKGQIESIFELYTLKESSSSGGRQEDSYFLEKPSESTINLESQKKLMVMRSKEKLLWATKVKTYYLSEVAKGVAGLNQRALEHLQLSLEVIKPCLKVSLPDETQIQRKKVDLTRLPQNAGKKTLVLDLDQTLFHSELERNSADDIEIGIEMEESVEKVYVSIRPYAISFLKRARKYFEIVAFTASEQSYADAILNELDPEGTLIHHRLYRQHCIKLHNKVYVKDLKILNRDLSQVLLVDNSPLSYLYQLDNGVPILSYYRGEDIELLNLEKYLEVARKERDVRLLNRNTFKLARYGEFSEVEELVRDLYCEAYY